MDLCRVDRREFVVSLFAAAALAWGAFSSAAAQNASMVEFVRAVYAREIELHNARANVSATVFFELFARELRVLMEAPRPYASREPAGQILHAFLGWGVLPGVQVKLVEVISTVRHGIQVVQVKLEVRNEQRQIIVRPTREDGLWKIANIFYENGDSLRAYYQRVTGRS